MTGDSAVVDEEARGTRVTGDSAVVDEEARGTRVTGDSAVVDEQARGTRVTGDSAVVDEEARGTRVTGDSAVVDEQARGTRVTGDSAVVEPAPITDPDEVTVRADAGADSLHRGGDLGDIDPADFVPVHEVLSPPPVPVNTIVLAVVSAALLLVIAFIGLGSVRHGGDFAEGQLLLGGQDVAAGETVTADFGEQVVVDIHDLPEEAEAATEVELRLSAGGVSFGTSSSGPMPATGRGTTDFGLRSLRILTGGELTGDLRFLDESGDVVASQDFTVDIQRPWYQTAAALGGLTILLIVLAYAISVATPLWLGRRRRSAGIALTWLGGFAGLAVLALGWSRGGPEPTVLSAVAVALLGAVVGAAGSWSLFRMRRRRRLLDGGEVQSRRNRMTSLDRTEPKTTVGTGS